MIWLTGMAVLLLIITMFLVGIAFLEDLLAIALMGCVAYFVLWQLPIIIGTSLIGGG